MRRESSSSTSPTGGNPSLLRRLSTLVQPTHSRSRSQSQNQAASAGAKAVWLDADPGHDDAMAMLMALHHPEIQLIGVSTVAGNASGKDTFLNAVRLMATYRASNSIPVIRGADAPLVKVSKIDIGIHGAGGLGGVQGLPPLSSPLCHPWLYPAYPKTSSPATAPEPSLFLYTLSTIITDRISSGKPPIHLAITGPMTNAALFIKCYPHLLKGISQIVLMGGAAGVRGNRGALAEFNILNDPEAASIVFNADMKVVMAGLNVTHQAIFTAELHDRLLTSSARASSPTSRRQSRILGGPNSPPVNASPLASPGGSIQSSPSDLKRMLSSTLTFFAKTYASELGFTRGPPVHDMLAIAYIIDPTLFHRRVPSPGDVPDASMFDADPHTSGGALGFSTDGSLEHLEPLSTPPKRYRVDVECAEGLACGATVVDFWGEKVQHEGWGRGGRNVEVLENLDCPRMWDIFFQIVERAEAHIAAVDSLAGKETENVAAE